MGDKDQGKDLDQCVGMFFYLDKNTKEVGWQLFQLLICGIFLKRKTPAMGG